MRILGLDFGSVRIGVAITDTNANVANALTTIEYPKNNLQYAIDHIKQIITKYDDIESIVVGYPTKIDNKISQTELIVNKFLILLRNQVIIPVYTQDESYSTYSTYEVLKNFAEMKNSQIKKIKDKVSAQIILDRYLVESKKDISLEELKQKCLDNFIPIVRDQTLKCIIDIINKNKYFSMLELGTAYGYSAMAICLHTNISKLTSIELRTDNFNIALNNLRKFKQIELINANAFEYSPNNKYDFIFFDACKSHQDLLFDKYAKYLNDNGTIFIDNIFLKKFSNKNNLTKNQIKLVINLQKFCDWLMKLENWNVKIIDIDDGFAIITRK